MQTGAPSGLVAVAGATGVTAPMKIAQLFDVLMFVIDAVQPACVPVPVVIVPSVLPVDGGQNANDHHHDQQLDKRETLAVHLCPLWE